METAGDRRTQQAPPFLAAACPRCGHLCEVRAGRVDEAVKCTDCGHEFVTRSPWDAAISHPFARRAFAWALILGGGACVLFVGLGLVEAALQEAATAHRNRAGGLARHWTTPFIAVLPSVAPLVSILGQWMLLRAGRSDARLARRVRLGWACLLAQFVLIAFPLVFLAACLADPDFEALRRLASDAQSGGAMLWRVSFFLKESLGVASPVGIAVMLLLLRVPSSRTGRPWLRCAAWLIAAGLAAVTLSMVPLPEPQPRVMIDVGVVVFLLCGEFVSRILLIWGPSAAFVIGGIMLLWIGWLARRAG